MVMNIKGNQLTIDDNGIDLPRKSRKENKKNSILIKQSKKHYFENYFIECPICKRTRRSGYIQSCSHCRWVIEYRDKLKDFIESLNSSVQHTGHNIVLHFNTWLVTIVFCEIYPDSITFKKDTAYINFMIASFSQNINLNRFKDEDFKKLWKSEIDFLESKVDNFIENNENYQKVISKFPKLKNMSLNYHETLQEGLKLKILNYKELTRG